MPISLKAAIGTENNKIIRLLNMNCISKLLDEKYAAAFVLLLTGLALLIRTAGLFYWMDIGGDGPAKAMYAYNWYKSPYIQTHGVWLPGFMYLTGSFSFIVSNPLISIRILNLILGTVTIPVFYILIRRVNNHISAFFGACILAFLPLHIGLSVSSLTEVSFILEIILGILFIILATEERRNQNVYLGASLLCICLAQMTRYEAWIFIPFFPSYFYWKTRKLSIAILLIFLLSIFPATWMIENYLQYGDFLIGFTAAQDEAWAREVGFFRALKTMGKMSVLQLEWTILILASWGVVLQCLKLLKRKSDAEQTLLLGMTLFFWVVMLRFAVTRGSSFQDRFLLLGLVMLLAFPILPLLSYLASEQKILLGTIGFILVTFILPKILVYYPVRDVTINKPVEIERVASWLRKGPYRCSSILMTKIKGDQSTFLPLYFPDVGPRFPDISAKGQSYFNYWRRSSVADSRVKRFMIERRPCLFITSDSDYGLQQDIERALGRKMLLGNPVHREGHIKIYDIRSITKEY